MKSRLYYAVISFILSGILLLIAVPLLSHRLYPKIPAVRVIHSMEKGEQLTEDDIEPIEVGALVLPEGIELTAEDVIGRYAAVELVKDDVLFGAKLSQLPLDGEFPKSILSKENTAVLIRLKMIEGSEYPVPETGNVVKLNRFRDKLMDIPELQFVRILSVVPPEREDDVVSVTVSLNEAQMQYMKRQKEDVFYASVLVRSNEELAEKLLAEQELFFKEED